MPDLTPARRHVRIRPGSDPAAARRILEALPDWFGIPSAIDRYVQDASDPSYASLLAEDEHGVIGIALTRRHFAETAELHLLAVDPKSHRTGVGRGLVERTCADLAADGCRFLTVHTVGPSFDHDGYARTRAFYAALRFVPLEEHVDLDWSGPTVIMVRPLG